MRYQTTGWYFRLSSGGRTFESIFQWTDSSCLPEDAIGPMPNFTEAKAAAIEHFRDGQRISQEQLRIVLSLLKRDCKSIGADGDE